MSTRKISRAFQAIRNRFLDRRIRLHDAWLAKKIARKYVAVDRSLDLGSGPFPRNPFSAGSFHGVDIRSYELRENIKKCNLGFEEIPFATNYFDVVTAYDVLEHIPRISWRDGQIFFPFIDLMNEVWRVLKVDGYFYSRYPCFPMKEAFQDPTHVNIMTDSTLSLYFSGASWARIYGYIGTFQVVEEGWLGSHHYCLLQKVSDTPVRGKESTQRARDHG